MRPRTTAILATAALGLTVAGAASAAELPITPIGTGAKTCVLKPGADCRGVVHRWRVEHHGNLRGAKFTGAHLHGADFRGADLRGADFRGAKLRNADMRDAKLRGARFDAPPKAAKRATDTTCPPNCYAADLAGANLAGANLYNAWFYWANLTGANLSGANLSEAYMYGANLTRANLSHAKLLGATLVRANLSSANLTGTDLVGANTEGAQWDDAICPNGTVLRREDAPIGCWPA